MKRDVLYIDKVPVCNIVSLGTLTNQAYAVKTLENNELILLDQCQLRNADGTALLRMMFADMPNAEAFIPVSFGFKKQMARLIAMYNLVENGKLNPAGVEKFCKNYNGYVKGNRMIFNAPIQVENSNEKTLVEVSEAPENNSQQQAIAETKIVAAPEIAPTRDAEYDFPMVERDVEQTVFLSGTTIRQDFKDIGSYSVAPTTINNQEGQVININDINGVKIAEATLINNEGECDLLTIKDNKKRRVTIPKADLYSIVKDLVMKLSFLMYL
jgi:hypothetical protein